MVTRKAGASPNRIDAKVEFSPAEGLTFDEAIERARDAGNNLLAINRETEMLLVAKTTEFSDKIGAIAYWPGKMRSAYRMTLNITDEGIRFKCDIPFLGREVSVVSDVLTWKELDKYRADVESLPDGYEELPQDE